MTSGRVHGSNRIHHLPFQRRLQNQPRRHAGADRADAFAGRSHAGRVGRGQRPLPQARAVAAARARGAGARPRLALHRTVDACRIHVRRAGCRQERARRRRGRRHRLRLRHPLHGQRQRFRHRCRRAAAVRPRQDVAGAGTGAGEQAALRAAGRKRRRQSAALPRRGFHPRRQHLSQSGAAVGGGLARRHRDAWFVDRRRRVSDRALRLHRDGARPHPRFPRRSAAAEGRDGRDRDRGRTRRRRDAHLHLRSRRLSGRRRSRCAAYRARHHGQSAMGSVEACRSVLQAATLRCGRAARHHADGPQAAGGHAPGHRALHRRFRLHRVRRELRSRDRLRPCPHRRAGDRHHHQ